jgi:hypothetical protein
MRPAQKHGIVLAPAWHPTSLAYFSDGAHEGREMTIDHDHFRQHIRNLFPQIKVREGWCRPEYPVLSVHDYRGTRQWVAGYSHSRGGAHHMNGILYDRILGWGDTPGAAYTRMVGTIERMARKK